MKATIESTDRIITHRGVEARVWEGVTESGVRFQALIARIAVRVDADNSQFQRELQEHKPPPESNAFDLRFFID